MKAQHTPGPWFITGRQTKYIEACIGGGMLQEIAAVGPTVADSGYGEQQEANARLIAAAPELLEALQNMLEEVAGCYCTSEAKARAAIAKATGGCRMTDRELLELAAKAAGIEHVTPMMLEWGRWDPLIDDGDALRLAVALGMNVALIPPIIGNSFCEIAAGFDSSGWPDVRVTEQHGNDPYAATRRAIVRAAAEIGKGME